MIRTFASEACSIEMWISSYMCHPLIVGLTAPAHPRFEPLPPGGRSQLREALECVPSLPRDSVRHLHLDRDDQVTGRTVLTRHTLAAGPQLAAARRTRRNPQGDRAVQGGHPQVG